MKQNVIKDLDYYHEQFCKQLRAEGKSPVTVTNCRDVYGWLKAFKPDVKAQHLTHDFMVNFMEHLDMRLRKVGTKLITRDLKPSSKASVQGKLNPFFNYLIEEEVIKVNPLNRIDYPNVHYDDQPAFTKEEFEKIFLIVSREGNARNNLIRKRNIAMVMFLALTGLRKNEFLNVRTVDLEFKKKRIFVRPETSKSKRPRYIPLYQELIPYLEDYLAEREDYNCEFLWVSGQSDRNFTEHGLKHFIKWLSDNAKFNCHVHKFRHTFAVNIYMTSRDLLLVKTLLGHQSLKMTMAYLRSINNDKLISDVSELTSKEFV